jgi:hypothetical protein
MYKFPVKYYEHNLIFNDSNKECWAVFRMDGYNYDYKSNENKIGILNRLARFIANIGMEAKILIVPFSQDIDTHYENLMEKMDKKDVLYTKAEAHAKGTSRYLKEKLIQNDSSNDYITYVLTRLKLTERVLKDIEEAFIYFIKNPVQSIYEFFSVETKDVFEKQIGSFQILANDYFKEQTKRISISKADALDMQWLYRRMFRRGLGEVKLRYNLKNGKKVPWTPFSERVIKNGEVAVRPHQKDILTLAEGLIDTKQDRCLKIVHGDGQESWQTFLAVSHIPDGIEFPGNEWLLVLQDYPVQTEVCIHIETVEHKKSLKDIAGKKREIQSQIDHIQGNNEDVPDELTDSKIYADQLEAELKATRAPIIRASISFCLAAASKEEMEDKVNFIREVYEDCNFIIERPIADQMKLFMEFIPGAGRYMTDYVKPLPPRTLAGGIIGATRLLGDNEGPYIGTTGILKKNVFLNLGRACLLDRSASAAFLGTLGGGKSFNANLLLYLNILYGGYGLIFDPKGERSKWLEHLPELKDHISIITLSPGQEDKGKLDPFIIYRDNLEEAGELALNILSEIFKLNPKDDEYLVILEAIRWTKQQRKPCMNAMADRLMNFPDDDEFKGVAKRVGRRIELLREAGMAGLLFGTGDEEGLSFKNRLNILQIQNLAMPDPITPKEDYTQEETISTVLMLPIASFAKKFAMSDRSVFKLVLFDESWGLSSTSMGIKLMNFLARMGRSLNAGCIFIGHSVNDLKGDGIKNAITYKFCFKTTEINEIKRVLEFLDLEVTDENINEVRNLKNGECLFQDLNGRVGKLKFDAVFSHLIRAFKTTPDEKKKEGVEDAVPA